MKKALSLILATLLALFALVGCVAFEEEPLIGGDTKSKDRETRETQETGPWKPEDITENPALDGDMDEGMVSEGRLYFQGSKTKTEALLVDSKGSLTWLYSKDKSIFETFDTGDYVRVVHGMIMESYPGQTYITRIALIENGDISSFTDEEWARLSDVFVGGLER